MFLIYYEQNEYDEDRNFVPIFVTENEELAKNECERLNDIEKRIKKEFEGINNIFRTAEYIPYLTKEDGDKIYKEYREKCENAKNTIMEKIKEYINNIEDKEIKSELKKNCSEDQFYFEDEKFYKYQEIKVKK